jgi:hypothetical protein
MNVDLEVVGGLIILLEVSSAAARHEETTKELIEVGDASIVTTLRQVLHESTASAIFLELSGMQSFTCTETGQHILLNPALSSMIESKGDHFCWGPRT